MIVLLCLSANHRTAGFSVLEKFAAGDARAVEEHLRGADGVTGAVVLSTCNRFEIYLDVDADAEDILPRLYPGIAKALEMPVEILRDNVAVVGDRQVPEYLFAVSSGLESVVVGEGEISGQVRRALEQARDAELTTSRLERLFQTASTTSKGVKAQTELQGTGRSLVKLSLDLAASRIADWSTANIVLVGTGAYAGASLKALRDRGVERVGVYSPSGRANRFAERENVAPIEKNRLPEHLANADLIVTCSTADTTILGYDDLRDARVAPGHAPSTLIIDLGLPRNVDPSVALLDGVDLLDLETIRIHAPLDSLDSADEARCIVARAASEFASAQAETEVTEGIAAMRRHVIGMLEAETQRVASRDAEGTAAESMRRLTNTFLHEPSVRAKQLAREGRADEYLRAIDLLFGVRVPERAPRREASPVVEAESTASRMRSVHHEA